MIDPVIVGAVGGIVIIFAWIYETAEAVKRHKSLIDLRFSVMSISGAFLLALYSLMTGSAIFLYLNIALIGIELFEITYSIAVKKVHKKKRFK